MVFWGIFRVNAVVVCWVWMVGSEIIELTVASNCGNFVVGMIYNDLLYRLVDEDCRVVWSQFPGYCIFFLKVALITSYK